MIILRRIFAVLLILVFVPLFLVSIVLAQVNSTVLSSHFYVSQLRKADLFNWAYTKLLPAAFDEASKPGNNPFGAGSHVQVKDIQPQVTSLLKTTLPPDWLEQQAETTILAVVPYAVNDTDSFTLTIPLTQPIQNLGMGVKQLAADPANYNLAFDKVITPALNDALTGTNKLPLGVTLQGKDMTAAAKQIVTQDWVSKATAQAVDQLVPYATGKAAHFSIVVPLKDRVQAASPAVKQLLRDSHAYDHVFDTVVDTLLKDNMKGPVTLPLGVTVTPDDVRPIVRQAFPPSYLQDQAEKAIDVVVPYLTGASTTFRIDISLATPKAQAIPPLTTLVQTKLQQQWTALSPCTFNQALNLFKQATSLQTLPPCRPDGFTLAQMRQALGPSAASLTVDDIAKQVGVPSTLLTQGITFQQLMDSFGSLLTQQVQQYVINALPNDFVYTDADLRKDLSADDRATLDKVLGWIRNGYTYTDADLRKAIGDNGSSPDALKNFDQVLGYAQKGFTFTQADFREQIGKGQDGQQNLNSLDTARNGLGTFRKLSFLLLLVPALWLAAIAFLGGRSWRGRLAWAVAPLLLVSGLAFIAFGPVYNAVAWPQIQDSISNGMSGSGAVQQVVSAKVMEVARSFSDGVVGGLATRSLVFLILSVLGLGAVIFWKRLGRLVKHSSSGTPPVTAPPAA